MLPEERRHRIFAHLQKHKSATIRQLASAFNVSEMTIHRDLQELSKQGNVQKVRGGALLKVESAWPAGAQNCCSLCRHPLRPHLAFTIVTDCGENLAYCCSHCALLAWPGIKNREAALAADMLTARTFNALQGWYVVGTKKAPCCKPGIFVFECREDAHCFAKGFSGQVMNFDDAVQWVARQMSPCCR